MQHTTYTSHRGKSHYGRLMAMAIVSFLVMYALMYAMVDRWSNVFANTNQFYMAGLMVAPMVIIEIALMSGMYPNKGINALIVGLSIAVGLFFWFGIRQQIAIDDAQFLKSMVPHHAGAILMCEKSKLKDPDLQRLCGEIVSSQQREIDLMKAKLKAID